MSLPVQVLLTLLLTMAPSPPVRAEQVLPVSTNLPARFSVTGVAADDVLNVRAAPDPAAPILAELPPDATGVEVIALSDDGAWALLPRPEGQGWASTRFLAPNDETLPPFPSPSAASAQNRSGASSCARMARPGRPRTNPRARCVLWAMLKPPTPSCWPMTTAARPATSR